MEDAKKWTVTYTKQVKQKRKVYQDGILHLLSNNKVMLYDEAEQLLDSKFLTKDEAVKTGESLTFASFLVDIGDPDDNFNPVSDQNHNFECNSKSHQKTLLPQGEKLRNSFPSRKPYTAGRKIASGCLSPSQKIIREFKKNEVLKYGAQSPTSPATSSFKEWEALYTTQLTQKAKKYHDGFIRMINSGSMGKQIVLYDSSKNQIDKRFMKKDDIINSGESLTFDAHLVDIGDPTGSIGDDADVKIQGRSSNTTEKSELLSGRQWKKPFSDHSASQAKRSKESTIVDHLGSGNSVVIGQPQDDDCSRKCVNSSAGNFESDMIKQKKIFASHLSVRDANQILSIMRKPIAHDAISIDRDAPVEQSLSRPSELVQLTDESQGIDSSLQVDRSQVTRAVENDNEKAANGGHNRIFSEDNSDNVENQESTPGIEILGSNAFDSPRKSKSSVGSSVEHGKPVLQSSEAAGLFDNHSSVGSEPTTRPQPSTKLPEPDPESKQITASTVDMSKCFGNLVGIKTKKSVKTEKSSITLDCPSFDLGI